MIDLSFLLDLPSSYNTWLIMMSLLVLGAGCAAVGCFAILNQQALISDVAAHATLPGIAIGFLVTAFSDVESHSLAMIIMLGLAAIFGVLGVIMVRLICEHSRLRADAAMGVVLSFFYGLGLVLITVIQRLEGFSAAGLDRFLLGQVTGITYGESVIIFALALFCLINILIFFRPLLWLCFDPDYMQADNPKLKSWISYLLTALIILIICAGLRTVGLVLFVALMIIPVSVIKPWRLSFHWLFLGSISVGLSGSYLGVQISSNHPDIPAGAAVVLSCAVLFVLSVVLLNIVQLFKRALS